MPIAKFRTNILLPEKWGGGGSELLDFPEAACPPGFVELLARGPEDFCDDPPRIRWGEWETPST